MGDILLKLSGSDFKDRLKKITPFQSDDEVRYFLNGVYLEYAGEKLRAVATNGHILCEMDIECESDSKESFKVILPRAAVAHLIKVIPSKTTEPHFTMTVQEDGKYIEFDFFEFKYITATINGTFPDYARVIPQGSVRMREGLNAKYLMAVLKALNNTPVDISVDDAEKASHLPHLLTSIEEISTRCVIMPMRV
jgi:DNA polymerase III sliding clamp (beta) subunit (PCNA family)